MPSVFQPNPGTTSSSGQLPGGGPTMPAGGDPTGVAQVVGNESLFGGDPKLAMIAAMRRMGWNPFASNPMVAMLMNAAEGLKATHGLSNLGAQATDVAGAGGPAKMFGDFLLNELQKGSVFGSLNNAAKNMPNYMGQMRDMQDQIGAGTMEVGNLSPFATDMEKYTTNANGLGRLLASIQAPGLGDLGQSWSRGIGNILTGNQVQSTEGWMTENDARQRTGMAPSEMPNFLDVIFPRGGR